MTVLTFPGTAAPGGAALTPTTIAVIGCGPSGLFFCHAMEKLRRGAEACNSQQRAYDITCFERSSSPGGVWRSATGGPGETTDMYDQLWMNGPSHLIEMYDYTFDEHFGRPVTVYLKRQEVFDYIISRVTKDCPDFFEKFVRFRTEVQLVDYDESIRKFVITTKDLASDTTSVQRFDKCIWACGDNGKQEIPPSLLSLFRDGGYKGEIIHSADVANLEHYVKDKRILLVGGAYSAEDLALQSIKLGVKKVFISTRDSESLVTYTETWPDKKVKILLEQVPVAVTEGGRCIQFSEVEWMPPNEYSKSDEVESEIRDIDTVIFCTGYSKNFGMLSKNLRDFLDLPAYQKIALPDDWKPKPHRMDEIIGGDIKPENVWISTDHIHPNIYHGMLVSNPDFVLLTTNDAECILFSLDVYAYATAKYITGLLSMPDEAEMRRLIQQDIFDFLDLPTHRLKYDENYYKAAGNIKGYMDSKMDKELVALFDSMDMEESEYKTLCLSALMRDVGFPDVIGTREELNHRGRARIHMDWASSYHRSEIVFKNKNERKWKTFRDCDDFEECYSLFTGTKAIGLERPWMEL